MRAGISLALRAPARVPGPCLSGRRTWPPCRPRSPRSGPLRRSLLRLLEEHAEAVERLARLAPHPPRRADLPKAINLRGRLAECGQLHTRDSRRLAREVVDRDGTAAAAAADPDLLDDPPRTIGLGDRELGVLVRQWGVELEASGGANPDRLHPREPVVVHEMVGVGGPAGEVADEVEHLLAGRRDDGRDGDLAHERAIVPASRAQSDRRARRRGGPRRADARSRARARCAPRSAGPRAGARSAGRRAHARRRAHACVRRRAECDGSRRTRSRPGRAADAAAYQHGGEVGHDTLFRTPQESCRPVWCIVTEIRHLS